MARLRAHFFEIMRGLYSDMRDMREMHNVRRVCDVFARVLFHARILGLQTWLPPILLVIFCAYCARSVVLAFIACGFAAQLLYASDVVDAETLFGRDDSRRVRAINAAYWFVCWPAFCIDEIARTCLIPRALVGMRTPAERATMMMNAVNVAYARL